MSPRFVLQHAGVPIGCSYLEHHDTSMGVAMGALDLFPAYEAVRQVFRLFAIGRHAEYYQARDALDLSIQREDGKVVPTKCIHVSDFSEELGPGITELEIILYDHSVWECFKASRDR